MKKNVNTHAPYMGAKKIVLTIPQFILALGICVLLSIMFSFVFIQKNTSTSVTTMGNTKLPKRLVNELEDSYALIKRHYIGEVDEEKMIDSALAGFVSGLGDKYTAYMNANEMKSLQETTEGEFEGIGVEIEVYNDYIRVVSPIDNSPAYKGGLQTGDMIIAVNGTDIKGKSTSETAKIVRGKKGTSVTLTISRNGSTFDVTLVRDTIPLLTVRGNLNGTVGILRISSFAKNTYDELVTAITNLRSQGAKSFVIDVRSNPGGLLDSVEKIVSMFVENDKVMFQMEDNASKQQFKSSSRLGSFKVTEPVVVLTNKGSASASEIFAAAIQELNRGIIVGETTFGKGTAQTIRDLSNTTGIKVTYSKWLTPQGNWVHEKGVTPNVMVALPAYSQYLYVNVQKLPKINDESDDVLNMQKVLHVLDVSISLTGTYDAQTQNAIRAFNQKHHIDGSDLSVQSASKMNELLKQKILENDTQLQEAIKRVGQ